MRLPATLLLLALLTLLPACGSSTPVRRNVEVIYRFENLRRPADAKSTARDEWLPIRAILDRAAAKPIQVTKSGVRTYGNLEVANFEARCTLPTTDVFQSVQAEIEALNVPDRRDRVETTLSSLAALYKSNFILAAATVTVTGASVAGHHIRLYPGPGMPAVDTNADSSGLWTAPIAVVPDTQWVYGFTEDPQARVPTKYFRINLATRAQEPVDEGEFLRLFPPNAPAAPSSSKPPSASNSKSTGDQLRNADAERLRKQREAEDAAVRKRRESEEQSRRPKPPQNP
jgi:hypothetical protein